MGAPKRFCFACREHKPESLIHKSGTRKNGARWWLCKTCFIDYRDAKEMERTRNSEDLITEGGRVRLGWNGVPSETSLRRRRS